MDEKIIVAEARIDATYSPKLEAMIKESLDNGENKLIIDFEKTVYISSVGFRVFVSTQKKLRGTDGYMILRNVSPKMMELFEVTGTAGVLTFE